jgi:integrase
VPGFLDLLRTDEELCRLDIGDLFAFMSFTGCRIGEALDLRWSRVDLEHGTVTFGSTVVRVRGAGLALQEQGKTVSLTRTISVPDAAMEVLRRRDPPLELVFPSMKGHLRDTGNTEDPRDSGDLVGPVGLEPTTQGLKVPCSTD